MAVGNTIRLSNYRPGIQADFSRNSKIAFNDIRAVGTRAGGLTGQEKRMGLGIKVLYALSGTRPTNQDIIITNNRIEGDPTVASKT